MDKLSPLVLLPCSLKQTDSIIGCLVVYPDGHSKESWEEAQRQIREFGIKHTFNGSYDLRDFDTAENIVNWNVRLEWAAVLDVRCLSRMVSVLAVSA